MLFGGIFGMISVIPEAFFADGEMNVFHLSGILSAFNFWLGDGHVASTASVV